MRRLAAAAGLATAVAVVATAVAAPLTGNIAVNQATTGVQHFPRVALQPGGSFLTVWEDEAVDDVHVRRFNAAGAPLTAAKNAAAGAGDQAVPDIGTSASGSAVITWVTAGDVFARRLDANGDPVGGVITVANQAGDQEDAKVAVSSGGAFAVVYVDAAGEEDVLMRRFEANGDPAGGVVNVAVRDGVQWTPNVAVHADGSFTVVYADEGDEEIFARRYEAGGNPIGAEITVFEGGPVNPDVVAVPGGFTVAFDEDGEVYSLGFDSAGNPRTDRERVNQNAGGLQNAPVADTAPDGRLVVAFNSSAGDRGALRQIRPDDLQAVGDDIPVSESGPAGAPIPGGIAADSDGFVVVWEADDANFDGVYARRFSWDFVPLPTATPTATPVPTASPVATAAPQATATPVATATPKPQTPAPPKLADIVRGLPSTKKCVSRRNFRIRLREPKGTQIRRATVKVNGKLVATRKGKRVTAPVDLRGLPKGRFKVTIRATTTTGKVIKGTRKYRTCVPGKKKPK